jgi:predicted DNA-binding protein
MQHTSRPRGSIMVRCPLDMRDQLREIAEREGETVSTVVRRLIAGAVNRAKAGEPILSGFEART